MTQLELANRFTAPFSGDMEKRAKQIEICAAYYLVACTLFNLVKESRRLSVALTELEGSMLWSLAAL